MLTTLFRRSLAPDLSNEGVRRRLVKAGLKHRYSAKKPLLTSEHKSDRLAWCRKWRKFDFSKVCFSDEKRFCLKPDGATKVWRFAGTRFLP